MATEKEKMLRGDWYHASDAELVGERLRARLLLKQFNDSAAGDQALRQRLLVELMPQQGLGLWIEPPFQCDYGSAIYTGENVYFNFNCVVLDVAPVTIGNNVLIGPAVQIYTAHHPMDWRLRAAGLEGGKPVTIGAHVWIGGGAIICPGVTIGQRSVIGAGSVVTRSIPDDVVAAGNPCRIIRTVSR